MTVSLQLLGEHPNELTEVSFQKTVFEKTMLRQRHFPTRQVPGHSCDLPYIPNDDVVNNSIKTGYCVNFRRRLRRLCMVSETNLDAKYFFKSTVGIHEEQRRHLKSYSNMIHPYSVLRSKWENFMIIIYFLQLVFLIPLELFYLIKTPPSIVIPKFVLDMVCYVDVIVNFFTGFVQGDRVVLKPKAVVRRYMGKMYINGLFWADVISSVPISAITMLMRIYHYHQWKSVFLFKLFRIPTLFCYIKNYLRRHKYRSSILKYVLFISWCFFGVAWTTTTATYLATLINKNKTERTFFHKDWIQVAGYLIDIWTKLVECIMLVGPDPVPLETPWQQKLLSVFYLLLGFCIRMFLLAQIVLFYKSRNNAHNYHHRLLQEIEQYANYRHMPADLKDKIMKYVDFKYFRNIVRENEITNHLSRSLKEEIMLNKCRHLVRQVEFFKDLHPALLAKIVARLKTEVFLKNEVIFLVGTMTNSMYFIYVGSVSVFTRSGREVMQLSENKHFGEVALLNTIPSLCTFMARTDCELLRLKATDLLGILAPYPRLCAKLLSWGMEKKHTMERLLAR